MVGHGAKCRHILPGLPSEEAHGGAEEAEGAGERQVGDSCLDAWTMRGQSRPFLQRYERRRVGNPLPMEQKRTVFLFAPFGFWFGFWFLGLGFWVLALEENQRVRENRVVTEADTDRRCSCHAEPAIGHNTS